MFVAAWPDPSTVERLTLLGIGPSEGLRLVKPEQWHITLRFLGEVDEDLEAPLAGALDSAARAVGGPVHCEAGPGTAWFGGDRVLQIPVSGLDQVAEAVRSATASVVPLSDAGRDRFIGHITLARPRRGRLPAPVRAARTGVPFSATFEVTHLDLVASQPSPRGHTYATLARVQLSE
jgi:2'-5' RNA ligase